MKILVTPRSFAKHDPKPLEMLHERGFEVVQNPYQRPLTEEEISEIIKDIDGVIIGIDPLNRKVLEKAVKLKAISKYGVGVDNIDLDYAKEKGIKVSRAVGANFDAVADFTMCLMLAVARKITVIDRECRKNNWSKIMSMEIYGKTLGIVGTGHIGRGVIKRAKGFDMNILAFDVCPDEKLAREYDVQYVGLEELYKNADIISLHVPLTEDTNKMIGKRELQMMKKSAILINTARGGLIDEDALYEALKENVIYGAGIDVFEQEPPLNKKLFELDNIVISSHNGASTFEAVDKMGLMAVENLIRDLSC
jgi:D-3-phosphoglycerate dehydrogenase